MGQTLCCCCLAVALGSGQFSNADWQICWMTYRAYWTLKTADQWLSLRLDFIGSCLILLTAMLAIAERNHISPSIAALSLSQVSPHCITLVECTWTASHTVVSASYMHFPCVPSYTCCQCIHVCTCSPPVPNVVCLVKQCCCMCAE